MTTWITLWIQAAVLTLKTRYVTRRLEFAKADNLRLLKSFGLNPDSIDCILRAQTGNVL